MYIVNQQISVRYIFKIKFFKFLFLSFSRPEKYPFLYFFVYICEISKPLFITYFDCIHKFHLTNVTSVFYLFCTQYFTNE